MKTPLELTNLGELDNDYFSFDGTTRTITVFNDNDDIPNPVFFVVLTNTIGEVVLWTYLKVTIDVLTF